jgi:hypothetical protein
MLELPCEGQSFKTIRIEKLLYVDKTNYIYKMATKPGGHFLSRPRRFGKSLILGALTEFFRGRRELFEALWIEPSCSEFREYPVVPLSMIGNFQSVAELYSSIMDVLEIAALENRLSVKRTTPTSNVLKDYHHSKR